MKKLTLRIITMLVMTVFLVVFSVACGNSNTDQKDEEQTTAVTQANEEKTSAAKEVKLVYATFIGEAEKDMVGICAKAYTEKNPNVTIETQVFDHDTYQQKIPIMSKSNTLPDLFWWNAGSIVDAFMNTQSIADLTPYIDDTFMQTLSPAAFVNLKTTDGKIVGFPAEMQVQGWMHNKALFDQYGLKIPTTFDELKEAVKVFKKNGIIAIAEGTKDTWPTWGFADWLNKWGYFAEKEKLFGTNEMKISESPVANAYKAIGELAELGAFPESASAVNFEQAVALFTSGKAAMISLPSDQLAKFVGTPVEKDCEYSWGVIFPDSPYDQKRVPGGVSNGYAVSSNTAKDKDKMETVVALNKFRFSEEGFKLSLKAGANLPSTLTVDISQFGKIIQDQARLIADKDAHIDITADNAQWLVYDRNWEAFGSKIGTTKDSLMNALIDGSIKLKDLPVELVKFDKIIADTTKAWKDSKK